MESIDLDILGITEHHQELNDFEDEPLSGLYGRRELQIDGFNVISTHRKKTRKGGIAWIYKSCLNIQLWEPKLVEESLKQYATERLWIRADCGKEKLFLGLVYMPTENSGPEKAKDFDNILSLLDKDIEEIKQEQGTVLIYGDFNSHVGNLYDSHLGIQGNSSGIGSNGSKILAWMNQI